MKQKPKMKYNSNLNYEKCLDLPISFSHNSTNFLRKVTLD